MTANERLVLILEDEDRIAAILRDYLQREGYATCCINNGNDALPAIREKKPDLILLDVMLPGRNGLDICRDIRQFSQVPILMLTARVEEIDRLLGLELGADDYICKPFSPREVVARVKAVLRRAGNTGLSVASDIEIDEEKFRISIMGKALDTTVVEFQLLKILAATPGQVWSRGQLMDKIYPDHRIVSERTIDSHVKKLRKKIDRILPQREIIHSVYGAGYKYEINW